MIERICLICGHTWFQRKTDKQLSLGLRQCGNCRGVDNLTIFEVEEMIGLVKEKMRRGEALILFDTLDVVADYTKKRGYNFRLLSTVRLIRMVLEGVLKK